MKLTPVVLAFMSLGLSSARPVPTPKDIAATSLPLKAVLRGRSPPDAFSKRAEGQLPRPAEPEPTKPEPTKRKPSTTEPRINWSSDYGTNFVRKWPALFLPWGSKDTKWDTHACEFFRRKGCEAGDAKIVLDPNRGVAGPQAHAYTVLTNLKPPIDGSSEVYISRDGRWTHPNASRPPEEDERWRRSRREMYERLVRTANADKERRLKGPFARENREAGGRPGRSGPSPQQIREAKWQVRNWDQGQKWMEEHRERWWNLHGRWRDVG